MNTKNPAAILIVAALVSPALAGPNHAVPRSGGGGSRSAPHPGGSAARSVPAGHAASARGTAGGVARYGHGGYGYGHGYYPYHPYYSYWGSWWYPWWGVGWYGGCWNCYGPAYYGSYQMYDDGGYDASAGDSRHRDPAIIETKVSPSNATVILDGEDVGFASDYNGRWDRLSVTPGKHSIAFRAKGYRSLTVELEAYPGATYALNDVLTEGDGTDSRTVASRAAPEPQAMPTLPANPARPAATGRLRINAEPGDAAVYLDGEYLGLAGELARIHGALAVPTGTHRLEAARPGFSPAVKTIDVGETELAVVELKLEAER